MPLPATYAFTGADGTALTTHSADWSYNQGTFHLQSNAVASSSGGENGARQSADVFNADHYVEGTITPGTDNWIGLGVRFATDGSQNYYGVYWPSSGGGQMFKVVGGSWTQLGGTVPQPAAASRMRMEAIADSIEVFDDGVSSFAQTDSALTTGAAGLIGFDSGTTGLMDDVEVGNIGQTAVEVIGRVNRTSVPPHVRLG